MTERPSKSRVIAEIKECLVLAVPLAGAQLSQSATTFVDTIMMGILGSNDDPKHYLVRNLTTFVS